jgi:hypothetical protein
MTIEGQGWSVYLAPHGNGKNGSFMAMDEATCFILAWNGKWDEEWRLGVRHMPHSI